MNKKQIMQIFKDNAYIRVGGSEEEKRCAEYLLSNCSEMGIKSWLEPFEVEMATINEARLFIDGKEIPCKGYLRNNDKHSLAQCKGKIVFIDGLLRYWLFHDLADNGALGYITFDGNVNYADQDIDQKELRGYISNGVILPGVNINAKDAVKIIKNGAKTAKIVLDQDQYKGESQNIVAELPGEIDEYIVFTAHYDSTSLSTGAYDNMSGVIGLLMAAEHFSSRPHCYGLRFVWCGSEERGLLGSKAYCASHEDELKKTALNINLDMIGTIMGQFVVHCSCEEKTAHYIEYMASELGLGIDVRNDLHSSDSTPFADKGVPAVSFARSAPGNTATVHNRYDTLKLMSPGQMQEDMNFIISFASRMANAARLPVSKEIPEKIKEMLDKYLNRKRE
ncbi:MAG: Zn-dependent exopeptidase M28 [Clostridiales bacterium]|nr:Zn-dependent exopeptidase M28 [Clostridiales bacterium]